MNESINLTAIYMTNLIGGLMMLMLLICRGWKIHTRRLTSIILQVMIITVLLGCIMDPLVFYADGREGWGNYFIVYAGNSLLYLLNIIIGPCFVTIVYKYINERISKLHINLIYILCAMEAVLLLVNLFVPIVFDVSDDNVYSRHFFFWIYLAMEVALLFDGVIIFIKARRHGRARKYIPMWLFIVPIAIGSLVQGLSYGVSLIWPCVGISVCGLVIGLKSEGIVLDRLTGLYNRYYFENVKSSLRKNHSGDFSGMMLDINEFKKINDKYGHAEGDALLKTFADILTDIVRSSGAVMRITADRFFILLDSLSEEALSNCKFAILNAIDAYNRTAGKPYKLSVSIGTNNFNIKEFEVNDLLDSFEKVMTAVKYGYESPVEEQI